MTKRVLVIDDQAEVCRLLERALQSFGYATRGAGDGNEAVRVCRAWSPDAIITDIYMPDMDGLELIRELRRVAPGVAMLAMSGGGNAGDLDVLRTARLMGAKRVLAKPFPMGALKQAMEDLIGAGDGTQAPGDDAEEAGAAPSRSS